MHVLLHKKKRRMNYNILVLLCMLQLVGGVLGDCHAWLKESYLIYENDENSTVHILIINIQIFSRKKFILKF
jgi:hypothetical protein